MKYKTPLFIILIATLLSGCNQSDTEHLEEKPKLEATTPFREDTSVTKEYVCQIHAFRHIEVRALERGYLQNIFVDEGQLVHQGQPMFKIMPNIYQAELLKAQAEANNMHIEYLNTKGLADQKIVSENELALAKAKLDKANAEVKLAETHLGFTSINAPFEGIMDHLNARNGSLVEEGALLTTLSDISKLWVYFNVPESEYLDFKTQKSDAAVTKVKLRMANGKVYNQDGVIETIEADFDNTAGNIEFRATFANPDKLLRHGETGTILMKKPYKHALLIPQKATFEILDKTYVYVIKEDGKLEQRLITIAAELPYLFIIKEGLQDGEKILLEGLRKVHAGDEVEINLLTPEKVRSELKLYTE
ncbi:Probable Co/Zn/Cd efflux system membrane fusion protein [Methylomonas albis]|uniref:Efflux RND transporter periplasmic adaptor subunit n=1 Tax=Methylomonas albis TaxID=1854563 RepID=A0ABR9CWF9_9GAMM|nr:efflux RND transporter periplasmic adaptor subunit [Methylomonas albis]MBD9355212.1 efflux RND transporter periplasmic adaptor subunit [Methylomonas albis]CAD6878165.1 Probable Co/Zn/Cd efflux system membrane fusion protein [Methylomonas albis]